MIKNAKLFKKITIIMASIVFMAMLSMVVLPQSEIFAQTTANTCVEGQVPDPNKPCIPSGKIEPTRDSQAKTCGSASDCTASKILESSTIMTKYVNPLIKLLTTLVGVVVSISLVASGVQYSSAGGDPSKVAEAKKRINNAITALLAFLFMAGFLQWLIPGGLI